MTAVLQPFHLAVPVRDLAEAEAFYSGVMELPQGRRSDKWIDYDLFGHQFVVHETGQDSDSAYNPVDSKQVPVPHFGVVLEWANWEALAEKFRQHKVPFHIEPYIRFAGQPGEQGTFFLFDPSGNALEFKTFRDMGKLFATT